MIQIKIPQVYLLLPCAHICAHIWVRHVAHTRVCHVLTYGCAQIRENPGLCTHGCAMCSHIPPRKEFSKDGFNTEKEKKKKTQPSFRLGKFNKLEL